MDNLASLQKIAKIINPDNIISSQEIEQVLKGIVDILTTYKKGTEEVRKETISVVNSLLEETIKYNKEHSKEMANLTSGMDKEHSAKMKDMERILNEATKMLSEIKAMEVASEGKDDSDDEEEKQALIEEVMARIELPEYKETIITGEELIDKINELPLDEENKIDYARLKNVPQIKGKVISGSPTVISNAVDLDGSTRQAGYSIVWDADRGRYTHAAGGGSGSPGGSTTQLQYNNAGAFGGISGATTNGTSVTLTSPTFITPALGTPASGVATNLTGTAAGLTAGNVTTNANLTGVVTSTGNATAIADAALSIAKTSGLQTALDSKQSTITFGTGVQTALGVNIGSAGAPVLFNGALGTPSSGTVTNLTGTASININGTVGATTPTTGSFTTVTTSGNIELGNASDTTLSRSAAGTLAVEGIRVQTTTPLVVSATSYTTDTGTSLNMDNLDQFIITAQAGALLFNAPGGTLVQGRSLIIRIKDNGTARALTWNAVFRAMGTALPSTTVLSKTLYLGFFYNSTDTKWDLVASAQES